MSLLESVRANYNGFLTCFNVKHAYMAFMFFNAKFMCKPLICVAAGHDAIFPNWIEGCMGCAFSFTKFGIIQLAKRFNCSGMTTNIRITWFALVKAFLEQVCAMWIDFFSGNEFSRCVAVWAIQFIHESSSEKRAR